MPGGVGPGAEGGQIQAVASGSGHQCAAAAAPAEKNNRKERNGEQQYINGKTGFGAEGEKRKRRRRGRPAPVPRRGTVFLGCSCPIKKRGLPVRN